MEEKTPVVTFNQSSINAYLQLQLKLDPVNTYNECIHLLIDHTYNYRIKDGIKNILNNSPYHYSMPNDIEKLFKTNNPLINDETRKLLMTNFNPDCTKMIDIIKLLDLDLYTFCQDKGTITKDCIDLMVSNVIYYNTFKDPILKLIEILNVDTSFLEKLCALPNSTLADSVEKVVSKGVKITVNCLENRLLFCDFVSSEILLNANVVPNTKCLSLACFYHKINLAKMILNCKVIPDKLSFCSIYANHDLCTDFYKSPEFEKELKKDASNTKYYEPHIKFKAELNEFAELLFKFGYGMTLDDLLYLMGMKITVENYNSRFGIVLDEKYVIKTWEMNYFPYDCPIKPTMKEFYKLCEEPLKTVINGYSHHENKLDKMIKKILKQGLKPDMKVLEILSKDKNNVTLIKQFMKTYDLKPNYICLKNIVSAFEEKLLLLLLEKYENNKDNQQIIEDNQEINKDNNLIELYEIIKLGKVPQIREHIKKKKLIPDTSCLEIGCHSYKVAEMLINEYNVMPNVTCIKTVSIFTKNKFITSVIDNYPFTEKSDNKKLEDITSSIIPEKYKANDRVTYLCRLNQPLDQFAPIREDFQEKVDDTKTYSKIKITVDKDNKITNVEYIPLTKSNTYDPTYVLICITIDILYNKETLAQHKKELANAHNVHMELIRRRNCYNFHGRSKCKYSVYIQQGKYPFDQEQFCNYSCHIKDYPFEKYIIHSPKDATLELIKTINVKQFYLFADTFKTKLVPLLGEFSKKIDL